MSSPSDLESRSLATIAALLIFSIIRVLALRMLYRRVEDARALYQWRKTITYFRPCSPSWSSDASGSKVLLPFPLFWACSAAGLAIALQDPIVNLAGWLFIMLRKPFDVGDRIQIGDNRGDVIDLRIFQFTLMEVGNWVDADQSTGRVIHIPNGKIFREAQANYSKGFQYIWNEVPVLVTFESDWKKAKSILLEIANRHAEHLSRAAEEKLRHAARNS